MEMHQVRYFLAVAEELNFTRASERCNVTQPSLSRAIKLLEEELGGLLFRRERESTHLTDLGHMVRPHLQSVYDHSSLAKRLSREFVKKSPLKLGIMSTISPDEIVDLIANIRTRHTDVELRLCDASAKDLRARLLSGDLEVAIYALPGEQTDDHIHSIALFREQMVLAVHRDHRLANAGAFPVREMNGEPYIHRTNCEFAGYADHILQEKGLTCNPVYWSERDDWTLAMVAAGLGFAFMPANAVKHPGVIGLPVVEPEFWRQVDLVSVRGRRYSPAVGSLVREAMRKTWFGKQPARVMHSAVALAPAGAGEIAA
ncbi:MAG TPA: LysR family transcriptional regulator [Roseiarcus sp.]|jgi:DNA-binding transcriptional LysR family regulator|nr:LysR family transcriptional regulator [Roseiarcus sp.]